LNRQRLNCFDPRVQPPSRSLPNVSKLTQLDLCLAATQTSFQKIRAVIEITIRTPASHPAGNACFIVSAKLRGAKSS
jgi:hypothetical protein